MAALNTEGEICVGVFSLAANGSERPEDDTVRLQLAGTTLKVGDGHTY